MNATIGGVPVTFFLTADVLSLAAIGRMYRVMADLEPVDYRSLNSLQEHARRCKLARGLEAAGDKVLR